MPYVTKRLLVGFSLDFGITRRLRMRSNGEIQMLTEKPLNSNVIKARRVQWVEHVLAEDSAGFE